MLLSFGTCVPPTCDRIVQDHQEFASHRLNKDVWSNETILTLLRGNFIFWQRNKALRQARFVTIVFCLRTDLGTCYRSVAAY